ncbi:MAG TPA: formylglycine-generating enzyme family protein, partial [Planctomycetota bacterium]|nr:formylglycine-generating enzyme family protein [Planctomycetota bacterium]
MRRALFALVTVLAACDQKPVVTAGSVSTLKTLKPASGGEMLLINGGEFTMGDAAGKPDEKPHPVTVGSFHIDIDPVTQELYLKVMGVNPSKQKNPQAPVAGVQWVDAVRFCNKCSEMDGLKSCYDLKTWACDFDADGYRLPTEAEWEYACRAGTKTRYSFGDNPSDLSTHAWTKQNSEGKVHPVGQKPPNGWSLRDMHGNVWQWCNDWYDENYYGSSLKENPRGPAEGKQRVLRGGAWDSDPDKCRAASRKKEFPVYTDACFGVDSNGFRRVKNPALPRSGTPVAVTPLRADPPPAVPKDPPPPPASGKAISGLKGTIVFVSNRSGALEIWRMHASG